MNNITIKRLTSAQRLAPSASPRAMTLIELMVVVVILTTLVAGVLPLISPNNDARKIREGARGLKTFMMMAQAEAARTGRAVGIGFRETSSDSGVAIEAYQLAVPPEYPGSSAESRVGITSTGQTYPQIPNGKPARFSRSSPGHLNPNYNGTDLVGARLYAVQSRLATIAPPSDSLPPGMFRIGDVFKVDGKRFQIVDDTRNVEEQLVQGNPASPKFLDPANNIPIDTLICVWLDEVELGIGKAPPLSNPDTGSRYQIARQPAGGDSANPFLIGAQPSYQFPAGIAIDLNASGYESNGAPRFFKNPPVPGGGPPPPVNGGIMFSPNGGVESIWVDGYKIDTVDRVFFLVGRGENGTVDSLLNYGTDTAWYVAGDESDDEIKDLRDEINWLNPESRWLMIEPAGNRLQVVENAVYDPRNQEILDEIEALNGQGGKGGIRAALVKAVQIEHAHELAHGLDHSHDGGQ